MRTFDIIGILAVGLWLTVTGLFVYRTEFEGEATHQQLDSEVALREGETWLLLERHQKASDTASAATLSEPSSDSEPSKEASDLAGYIQQQRTRLVDGWLLEYEALVILELLGAQQVVEATLNAQLTPEAYLKSFTAEATFAGETISVQGDVEGKTVSLLVNAGGFKSLADKLGIKTGGQRQKLQLASRPRLVFNAIHQVVARDGLAPGETFRQEYFDPTALRTTSVEMTFVERRTLELYGDEREALHLRQTMSGNEYDIFVSPDGEVLVQEFPMKMIGRNVPPELGRARRTSLENKVEKLEENEEASEGSSGPPGNFGAKEVLDVFRSATPNESDDASNPPTPSDGSSP